MERSGNNRERVNLRFERSGSLLHDNTETMDRMRSSMIGSSKGRIFSESGPEERRQQETLSHFHFGKNVVKACRQVPAILLIVMFHLMIGIPFGVSYFPIGWQEENSDAINKELTDDFVKGTFPLPGKEALGIRMFLFATAIGQFIFTATSGFINPIGLQMVENVPFCHALAQLVIQHQGYGIEALSTLFLLFGLSSIIVGMVFMVLGKLNLGRVIYYIPNHVLVGCIAGIGVFLAKTGFEVTMGAVFSVESIQHNWQQVVVVICFEFGLRVLDFSFRDKDGKPKYSLLSPIYFCMITPIFYLILWLLSIEVQDAMDAGYFFPSLQGDDTAIIDEHLFDMWRFIDFTTISWSVVLEAIPTLISLTLFSLIHVPINIPAYALSSNTEVDMNRELVSHGYSNLISGLFGGLQNYMAYTQSVIYDKSGGKGKASGTIVGLSTIALFFFGPTVASFIPRCMAGTLLLHVGIDLFLEGVYDSYSKFDVVEYGSVLLIIIVMTVFGMDDAMIAGVFTGVFAFVAQNLAYTNPVRGSMSAATLRSDNRQRPHKARAILDDNATGRSRILVIQLQGHLFFGNVANLTKSVHDILSEQTNHDLGVPLVIIFDFSLVVGIDSSASQAISKLKNVVRNEYAVELSVFVSGSAEGFPCIYDLSKELKAKVDHKTDTNENNCFYDDISNEEIVLLGAAKVDSYDAVQAMQCSGSHVSTDLNTGLIYAENYLIARQDPNQLDDTYGARNKLSRTSSFQEERQFALGSLMNLCPIQAERTVVEILFSKFEREIYKKDDFIWKQGTQSTSIKIIVRGMLISILENEAGTVETISVGNTIGELGVIEGVPRISTVKCMSEEAVVYSLNLEKYKELAESCPKAVRLLDLICISYLSARVQHVSNRVFETRCLPI